MANRMPQHARKLTELLEEKQEWNKNVSALFVQTRSAASVSQDSFAGVLGISQPYLSQIENGVRTPSSETLSRLHSFVEGEDDGNSNQES